MIRPANIYYMLAYAFDMLDEQNEPRPLGSEKFENADDLCAAILAEGLKKLVRQGIRRGYVPQRAPLAALRGRLDWQASINSGALFTHRLVCAYDEFLSDIPLNRILKTTLVWLRKAPISGERKTLLASFLPYFKDVQELDPHCINWRIGYDRNVQSYRLLIYICRLVLEGRLQRQADGTVKIREYLNAEKMSWLYERFILKYYRRHFPETNPKKTRISWALDGGDATMLPQMETDVQLSYGRKILIIDAKYHKDVMQRRYDAENFAPNLISKNLYQIFCYVKNKAAAVAKADREVSGLLLHALTDEGEISRSYEMSGNTIGVRTLDLGAEFPQIMARLDAIAGDFLGCARQA